MTKPLEGLRVLVTRARKQASDLVDRLEALGATAIVLPAIEIGPSPEPDRLDEAIKRVGTYHWVVFTSVNGVAAFEERRSVLGVPLEALMTRQLAVIGPATAKALAEVCREPDVIPDEFVAEAILDQLEGIEGQRFLLARADIARKELAEGLRAKGAIVDEVAAYSIIPAETEERAPDKPDIVTFTSSSGVRGTVAKLREHGLEQWLDTTPIVCIGPITAGTVRELDYHVAAEATDYTIPGLVEALVRFVEEGKTNA